MGMTYGVFDNQIMPALVANTISGIVVAIAFIVLMVFADLSQVFFFSKYTQASLYFTSL